MKQKNLMIFIVALTVSLFMITGNAGALYLHDGSAQNGSTGLLQVTNTYCVGPDQTGATNNATKLTTVAAANCSTRSGVVAVNAAQNAYVASLVTPQACTNAGYNWSWTETNSSYQAMYPLNAQPLTAGALNSIATATNITPLGAGKCSAVFWTGDIPSNDANEVSTYGNGIAWFTYANEGCLRCHNSAYMATHNAPQADKSNYVLTGHRNMLRKVIPGMNWAGPNQEPSDVCNPTGTTPNNCYSIYTTDGTNSLSWGTGDITLATGGTYMMYYIWGDWIAANPIVARGNNQVGTQDTSITSADNGYSCGNCHTAGYANCQDTTGYCSVTSVTTTGAAGQAACAAANGTWLYSTGIVNGGAAGGASCIPGDQPLASFPLLANTTNPPSVTGVGGSWDLEGIRCSRCHESTNPTYFDSMGNQVTSEHDTATPSGTAVTNLCVGCHNSLNSGQTDPAQIPVSVTAAGVGSINNHAIGMEYLNSPHARFTGTLVKNELGEQELNGVNSAGFAGQFNSHFIGSAGTTSGDTGTCTVGSATYENQTSTTCTALGGTFSSEQGNCESCHDVHNSIEPKVAVGTSVLAPFAASTQTVNGVTTAVTTPAAIKRECITCHAGSHGILTINHPFGPGTPMANYTTNTVTATSGWPDASGCVICHMAAGGNTLLSSAPLHLFRINADPSYSTYPTYAQYKAGQKTANTATTAPGMGSGTGPFTDSGPASGAVWVDIDLACGQCHGGGTSQSAPAYPIQNGAPYLSKAYLAGMAQNMHSSATGATSPVASFTDTTTNLTVTLTDTSTAGNNGNPAGSVQWGDGTSSSVEYHSQVSHAYSVAGTYQVVYSVTDSANNTSFAPRVTLYMEEGAADGTMYTISGTVNSLANGIGGATSTLINNAQVSLMGSTGKISKTTTTDGTGHFSLTVPGGTYSIMVSGGSTGSGSSAIGGYAYTLISNIPVSGSLTETIYSTN